MGFSRQDYWSGLLCTTPRDFPDQGIEPASLMFPALAGRFFTTRATWEAQIQYQLTSFQFSRSVMSDSLQPHECSMPGLPVHHQLPEFTQTHVHRVSDAIQPSHPRRPLLLLPQIPPSIRVFSNELALRMRWPKYWSFSFSILPPKQSQG